jgi:D-alanyl-D-alanine carboxypeptidase
MKAVLLISVVLLACTACDQNKPDNPKNMNNIPTILDNEISKGKTPSVQYLFFSADSILFEYSAGYSDLKSEMKVDTNTTFNALSITKTFTAAAIMQLVQQNLVSLEKSVQHYLPSSRISEKVLVKHLMNHTAGLANPLPLRWIHLYPEHNSFNRDEFFSTILDENIKLKSEPGSRFSYSNLGYIYLARIVEAVSGMSYEDYVAKNIFDKLQLGSDALDFNIPHEISHAKGYHSNRSLSMLLLNFMFDRSKYMEESVGKWKPFKLYYVNGAPYGGLIGNSRGLVKYGQEMLKENSALLSESSKERMFSENVDEKGRNTGMCLSWYTGQLDQYRYVTHAGGGGGYYCELRLYPEIKAGSFIVFNRSGFSDERYLNKLDVYLIYRNK